MDNILMIAMEFPPRNTTGAFRPLKFAKYLSEFGHRPIILTLSEDSDVLSGSKIDKSLLDEIPSSAVIYRSCVKYTPMQKRGFDNKLLNFFRIYFKTTDGIAQKWLKSSFKSDLEKAIQTQKPKAIYITLPPFSAHKLVQYIKSSYTIPVIVDMRDAWSQWSLSPWTSYFHYRHVLSQERKLFKLADKIIGVTNPLNNIFKKTHPSVDPNKFLEIPNGHDYQFQTEQFEFSPSENNKIRIGYIGSFYFSPNEHNAKLKKWYQRRFWKALYYFPVFEDWSYRSPIYFLQALKVLLQKYPQYKNKITFEHIGRTPDWLFQYVQKMGLEHNFVSHGFVPYKTVLELQKSFDCFLATSEKIEQEDHYCLPSKLFDYLREQKPILGFLTKGVQRDFLNESGVSKLFDPDKIEENAEALHTFFSKKHCFSVNANFLNKYSRKNLTHKLAIEIKNLTQS